MSAEQRKAPVELASLPEVPADVMDRPETLTPTLTRYVGEKRWFRGKSRSLHAVALVEKLPFAADAVLAVVSATYNDGPGEEYILPLAVARGAEASTLLQTHPGLVIARLGENAHAEDGPAILCDALARTSVLEALLDGFREGRRVAKTSAGGGDFVFEPWSSFEGRRTRPGAAFVPKLASAEQTNTSILFGNSFILKLVRRIEREVSPDLEVGAYLTETAHFPHSPAVSGALVYQRDDGTRATVAVLHAHVTNEGDAWEATGRELARVLSLPADSGASAFATSVSRGELLGQRTAELHKALGRPTSDARFSPMRLEASERAKLATAAKNQLETVLATFSRIRDRLDPATLKLVADVEARVVAGAVNSCFRAFVDSGEELFKCRIHGDLHLGQILFTGSDFVFIDFEGEPLRSMEERKGKRSPLADVAGVLQSFHYASAGAGSESPSSSVAEGRTPSASAARLSRAEAWYRSVYPAFLGAYRKHMARGSKDELALVPESDVPFRQTLDFYLLEKCIYEMAYEADNRPPWLWIPLRGFLELTGNVK